MTEAAPPTPARPADSDVRVVHLEDTGVTTALGDIEIRGGFGSDLAIDPRDPEVLHLLADRGPNFDTGKPFQKGFALPSFAPSIARFRLHDDRLLLEGIVKIRSSNGRRLSGLPNPPGEGGTGEIPVTADGRLLPLDRDGIDPEGLVVLSDGTFWVADEYGPHLLHLDGEGKTLLRVNPYHGRRRLPRVLARRGPNRGLEGLTVTPDEQTLVGVMQSPLENPTREAAAQSRIARIVTFDLDSGGTRQFLYAQEDVGLSNSAIAALSETAFLVIEHDALLPGDPRAPAWIKRIYRIDLEEATDVSDPLDGEAGILVGGRALEELSPDELRAAGVELVRKTLVLDLLALDYPHDKPEGLALMRDGTLAVLNDDDFGITSPPRGSGRGKVVPKVLPRTGEVSTSELWLIPLPPLESLAGAPRG